MTAPTIPTINDLPSMVTAINAYVHGTLPANFAGPGLAAATAFYPSPVDLICTVAEALYAAAQRSALDEPGMIIVVQAANFCMMNGWHNIGQTGRGTGIVQAMRRTLGDTTITQTPAQDPAPLPGYA